MTIICPCCFQPAPEIPPHVLELIPKTQTGRTIINALARVYPSTISSDRLVDLIYSGAILPGDPENCTRRHVERVRKALSGSGWTIINEAGKGMGVRAQYRLAKVEESK
jgi:hypothetical protein